MARSELAAAVVSSFLAGLEDLDRRVAHERLTQLMQRAPADAAVAADHARAHAEVAARELSGESSPSV